MCREGVDAWGMGGGGEVRIGGYSARTELQQRSVSLILKQNAQRGWGVTGGWGRGGGDWGVGKCSAKTEPQQRPVSLLLEENAQRTARSDEGGGGWRGWVSGVGGGGGDLAERHHPPRRVLRLS